MDVDGASVPLSVSPPSPRSLSLTFVFFAICYLRIPEHALREGRVPPGGCDPSSLVVPDYREPTSAGEPAHHEEQEPRDLLIHSSCSRKFGLLKYSGTGSSNLEITL